MKVKNIKDVSNASPTFDEVRSWYESNLAPNVIDFDDLKPYEVYSEGKFAGIFQLTSKGAQKFFLKAKPKNVIDIAALTSIYRPGPLAANVDDLWLKHEKEPYDWGHPLINETLKETRGLLVFQEGVMALANKVAGFPLDETDEVRRAIMKRSISGGEAAKQKAKELEDSFVAGCMKNGVPEDIAKKTYQTILFMSGYAFNKSHAVAYAIDSFWCAWLLTYHEEKWLTAYVESMLNNPDQKAKAFEEIKRLGYKIVPIDINHAGTEWQVLPGKRFMPSFLSCKGIGESAIEEIVSLRPFSTIEEMLWNEDGSWRLSKFNRKALEALIKVEAFDSLECVGEDKLFGNYAHMHEVLIENNDQLKKSLKKDPHLGRRTMFELARGLKDVVEPWSRKDRAKNQVDVLGSLDVSLLLDQSVIDKLANAGVHSIDSVEEGRPCIAWFCVQEVTVKRTKNGKQYVLLTALGQSGKSIRVNVWNAKDAGSFEQYGMYVAEVSANNYGLATTLYKVKQVM